MVSEAVDINTDPSYGRIMDLDTALGISQGLDVTLVLCGKQVLGRPVDAFSQSRLYLFFLCLGVIRSSLQR